jgi:phosphohistidine phosphatase
MNRTLYIIRHAQAEDGSPFLRDHDRELLPEGTMTAARLGRALHERGLTSAHIISSTATRTRQTATIVAEQLQLDPADVVLDAAIYDQGPKAYLAAINAIPDSATTALICGHNPDVSYVAEYLTHQPVGSMNKGAVVGVEFTDLRWAEISGRTGQLVFERSPIL